ncbi:MAG: toxin-antitoxin system YwqK family antitoxin [Candidatus Goldbacteria bacterium]|nr:toxin-antitoxin system YwqK family antitoxin [Candidatus Goldiibacteriota bacterium]
MKNTKKALLLGTLIAAVFLSGCTVYVQDSPYDYSYTERYYSNVTPVIVQPGTAVAAATAVPTAQVVVNNVNITNIDVEVVIKQEGNKTVFYRGNKRIAVWSPGPGNTVVKTGEKITATVRKYNRNGVIIEKVDYKNNLRNGISKIYDDRGNLKIKTTYRNDVPDGAYYSYYENGAVETYGYYRLGKKQGAFKYYYSNGLLKQYEEFDRDVRHGRFQAYDKNGNLKESFRYINGKKEAPAATVTNTATAVNTPVPAVTVIYIKEVVVTATPVNTIVPASTAAPTVVPSAAATNVPEPSATAVPKKDGDKTNQGNHFGSKRHADGWENYKRMKEEQAKKKDKVKAKDKDENKEIDEDDKAKDENVVEDKDQDQEIDEDDNKTGNDENEDTGKGKKKERKDKE